MIGSLRGTVADHELRPAQPEALIEVAGVGYRVTVTPATLDRMQTGTEVHLHIHHHISEATQRLYGFLTKDERVAFEGLVAARGIGPAVALSILATHGPVALARILADDDLDALCQVPGVGKKTAQRLLVELKSTLVLPTIDLSAAAGPVTNGSAGAAATPMADVREALGNLGYSAEEIRRALAQLPPDELASPDADPSELLRAALRGLAGA